MIQIDEWTKKSHHKGSVFHTEFGKKWNSLSVVCFSVCLALYHIAVAFKLLYLVRNLKLSEFNNPTNNVPQIVH